MEHKNGFPLVTLGNLLTKSEAWIELDPTARYREVTVRLWGNGVVLRHEVAGSEIAAGRRLQVHTDQFIISRIDARHGASGLIPPELNGAVVSSDFPVFALDEGLILPQFLGWLSKTRQFIDLCLVASEGTTNRVRLQEKRFLALEIPLPPLPEQRRIVARIEALAAKITEARGLRQQAVEEVEALMNMASRQVIGEIPGKQWISLDRYVQSIENGKSPACESRPATADEWGVLKVGAVSFGYFEANENKALPINVEPNSYYEVRSGDFLMSRANTTQLVGACAIVQHTRPKLLLSDKTFRFVFCENMQIEPQFLNYVLKSPALRSQLEQEATGTSPTMKNISKEKVLNLLIPEKDLPEQRRIVAYLDGLQAKVDAVRQLQAATAAELEALLPAVLDRAFRGEL